MGQRFFVEAGVRAMLGLSDEVPWRLPLREDWHAPAQPHACAAAQVFCGRDGQLSASVLPAQHSFRPRPLCARPTPGQWRRQVSPRWRRARPWKCGAPATCNRSRRCPAPHERIARMDRRHPGRRPFDPHRTDKAMLDWHGQSLLAHMQDLLRRAGASRVVVSRCLPRIRQRCRTSGRTSRPIGGLCSVAQRLPDGELLVVAVDMPALQPAVLRALQAQPRPRVQSVCRPIACRCDCGWMRPAAIA